MTKTLFQHRQKAKKLIGKILVYCAAALIVFFVIFPFLWMIPASLKGREDIWSIPPRWLPRKFIWENFKAIAETDINGGMFLRSFGVTLVVGVSGTFLNLFVNTLAAYGFARHEFWGKRILWCLFLFTMFVPGITVQVTSLRVATSLRLTDTLWVLILPSAANAYNIFFFRQFFLGIPDSLEEAAQIDGAGRVQCFFKIFLPLSVTPMIITGFGCFLGHWNSYIWPTLAIVENQGSLRQVMQFIYMLSTEEPRDYGKVIAVSLVAISCPLILFAFFQRKIVEGITLTGLK